MSSDRAGSSSGITAAPVWHACPHCASTPTFQTTADFVRHLQDKHCTRLTGGGGGGGGGGGSGGGSGGGNTSKQTYVCRFGAGGTCSVLSAKNGSQQQPHRRRSTATNDYDDTEEDDDDDEYDYEQSPNRLHPNDTFEQHVLRHHLSPIVKRKTSTASNRTTASATSTTNKNQQQPSSADDADDDSDWTIFSSSQNLPAVLNDPSRGKQSTLFTKKWGDTFVEKSIIPPSIHLKDITYDDLDSYMQRIGKRYRRHQRLKSVAIGQPADFAGGGGGGEHQMSDIPAIFLQQQLQLNDPAIFVQVFAGLGRSAFAKPPNAMSTDDGNTSAASAAAAAAAAGASARLQLQEKLSHYLDVVEVHITRRVSQQSGAFFAAMTSQHAIMAEMHAAMLNVRQLRRQIAAADATLVQNGLLVCATRRRQHNQAAVVHKLKIMSEVHKTQPMIQQLLGTADYVAAIDLIGSTQELLARELRDVHCLKHLPSQLHEMQRLIDKMLRTEFERFATADLNRRVVDATAAEEDDDGAKPMAAVADEERLVGIVWGLLRQRNFAFIETYRDEAIVTVRALIKEMMIEVLASGDAECCLTGAGEESQSLSIGEWIELLDRATGRLLALLRRVRAVVGVMQRIAAQSAGQPLPGDGGKGGGVDADDVGYYRNEAFLQADELRSVNGRLADLMHTICNYCHERCATLISSQSLERNVATAAQVERLQGIVRRFSRGCESLTVGESSGALVGGDALCLPLVAALNAQATRFVQKFHADRRAKLAVLLDSERWRQIEVPTEIQRLVDAIAAGKWTQQGGANDADCVNGNDGRRNGHSNSNGRGSNAALLVENEPFVLVGSALILLQIIDEYARCAVQLPLVTAQLARNVVDLLRTFNSRSCQLVLGAGAMRVAGLKTITSANLALVARALQLVVWLLPHIRRHFQRVADETMTMTTVANGNTVNNAKQSTSTASVAGGYDIVERDLLSHITEVDAMILSIVTQLVTTQMDGWTARPPVPSPSFRNISRHFVKLHEAIAPIMPADQVRHLYAVVHRTFKDKLREQLARHGVVNNGGPGHGVVTAELTFYVETLRTLGVFAGDDSNGEKTTVVVDELSDEAMADVWKKPSK